MKIGVRGTFVLVASLLLVCGCAGRRTAYDELYRALSEEPVELDWSVLEGRRIVIDPGHGGYFDGAIGPDSLSEADVNLGVALYLWGLLEEAGARVLLTRTTDRDFLPPDSTGLRGDLEARMKRANDFDPEVFISIHHNSNLPLDRDRNIVEVYYRGDDPLGSLDLARYVHLHLARNLGIEQTAIKPGNYYVLRSSEANASVLGEASYISNPQVEGKLKLSNKQRLEAEAYFLGLLSYFSAGVPVVERVAPSSDTLRAPEEIVFSVRPTAGVPVDPSTARLYMGDGVRIPHHGFPLGTFRYPMELDLPNESFRVRFTVESLAGMTGSAKPFELLLSRPAAHAIPLPVRRDVSGNALLSIKVLDRSGMPVADGTEVSVHAPDSAYTGRSGTTGGLALFDVGPDLVHLPLVVRVDGLLDTLSFSPDREYESVTMLVVDDETGRRIPHPAALLTHRGGSPEQSSLSGDGRGILSLPDTGVVGTVVFSARGYEPREIQGRETEPQSSAIVRLRPLFGGWLRGRRITLDPAAGGADAGGVGADRERGATVNREVARLAGLMLESGGALVAYTRSGEESISQQERIHRANRFGSHLAIGIHHDAKGGGGECGVQHYPGSDAGRALAACLSIRLSGLPPCERYTEIPSAGLFLQQTSCPAVEIHARSIEEGANESILTNRLYPRLMAERIVAAIIDHLSEGRLRCIEWSTTVLTTGGEPVEGAAVTIDQALTARTGADGRAAFCCIPPGLHYVTVSCPSKNVSAAFREIGPENDGETIRLESASPETER